MSGDDTMATSLPSGARSARRALSEALFCSSVGIERERGKAQIKLQSIDFLQSTLTTSR